MSRKTANEKEDNVKLYDVVHDAILIFSLAVKNWLLDTFDSARTFDETADSCTHLFVGDPVIYDYDYGCRWCGHLMDEPQCPCGCGHTWVVKL
jgi:hypothetical protein